MNVENTSGMVGYECFYNVQYGSIKGRFYEVPLDKQFFPGVQNNFYI